MRMEKKKRNRFLVAWLGLIVLTLVAVLAVGGGGESVSIKETMRDAVLHGTNRISLFGLKAVDPAFISALVVSGVLLLAALLLRLLVIPRFRMVPGKLQLALEELVGFFDNLAKAAAPTGIPFWARMCSRQACISLWGRCLSCSAFRR